MGLMDLIKDHMDLIMGLINPHLIGCCQTGVFNVRQRLEAACRLYVKVQF